MNQIKYVSGKDGIISIRKFVGYGQEIKVYRSRKKTVITVLPENNAATGIIITNPGLNATFCQPICTFKEAENAVENMSNAIAFCKEYSRREHEFKHAADIYPATETPRNHEIEVATAAIL